MTTDKLSSRERLYIPAVYVDEVCPEGRAVPSAWIGSPAAEVWYLAAGEEDEDPEIFLTPGKVVEFAWVERLGEVEVEIREDGTHVARSPVPAGITHFTFGLDLLADSLDEFVREWLTLGMELDEDRLVLVDMARWSERNEAFRFEVTADGPRFLPVAEELLQ